MQILDVLTPTLPSRIISDARPYLPQGYGRREVELFHYGLVEMLYVQEEENAPPYVAIWPDPRDPPARFPVLGQHHIVRVKMGATDGSIKFRTSWEG